MARSRPPQESWRSLADLNVTSRFTVDMTMVTVEVGLPKKEFVIHKQQALDASPYFHAAFGGNLEEGRAGILKLPDEDPDVFWFVVDFIYRKTFGTDNKPLRWKDLVAERCKQDPEYAKLISLTDRKEEEPEQLREMNLGMAALLYSKLSMYAKIWKLADYLQMPALQNLAMSRLYHDFEYGDDGQSWMFVKACYYTPEEASIRTWISDVYSLGYRKISEYPKPSIDEYAPRSFLIDVCIARGNIATTVDRTKPFYYELNKYLVDEKPVVVRAAEKIV